FFRDVTPFVSGVPSVFAVFLRLLASNLLLSLGLLAGPLSLARAQEPPAVPEGVFFQAGVEYANPDNQHLKLNLARPRKGNGPFPAVLCIHGGGFRAGT